MKGPAVDPPATKLSGSALPQPDDVFTPGAKMGGTKAGLGVDEGEELEADVPEELVLAVLELVLDRVEVGAVELELDSTLEDGSAPEVVEVAEVADVADPTSPLTRTARCVCWLVAWIEEPWVFTRARLSWQVPVVAPTAVVTH